MIFFWSSSTTLSWWKTISKENQLKWTKKKWMKLTFEAGRGSHGWVALKFQMDCDIQKICSLKNLKLVSSFFLTPKTKRETWLIILEREKLVESIGLSSAIGDTVLSTRDPLSSFIRSNLHPIQIVLFVFFCSLSLLMNSTWTSK